MAKVLKTISLSLCFFIVAACSTDNSPTSDGTDDIPVTDDTPLTPTYYNKLIRVENFAGVQGGDHAQETNFFYSLEENKAVGESYRKTSKWDIGFGGILGSFMSGNNGENPNNYGSGTQTVGGIYIIEKPFDEVIAIPADAVFRTGKDEIGTDDHGDFGEGIGWYLYDFGGTLVRDGSYDNAHIAYALDKPLTLKNGTIVPARTIVVKTAKGDYAKLKMISVYKDILDREQFTRTAPKMFFTFEYVLVPKGSTTFEIKN